MKRFLSDYGFRWKGTAELTQMQQDSKEVAKLFQIMKADHLCYQDPMYRINEEFQKNIPVYKIMTKVEMLNLKAKQNNML